MTERGKKRILRIIGLGADNDDGHLRQTAGRNYTIYQGSEKSHQAMEDVCERINEKLKQDNRRLQDLSRDEFINMVSDIE